jgi:preprotein translocase subunit SecA
MQTATELTPIQLTFLDWVTRGLSIEEAAKEIEQRWANIMDWKRNIPEFHLALEEALECRAMLIRERAHALIYEALDVLQKVLRDFKASASVRLRASLALIKISTKPESIGKRQPAPKQQPKSENRHNSAQAQPIRLPVEPGRNSICPCGSGVKFKRCCGNPVPATATAEATTV